MALRVNKNDASAADSRIKGNVSPELKQQLETIMYDIMARSDVFGSSVGKRVVITEAAIVPKAEEPSRTEARVVCEVTVEEGSAAFFFVARVGFEGSRLTSLCVQSEKKSDMLNPGRSLHGGCAAFLIDRRVIPSVQVALSDSRRKRLKLLYARFCRRRSQRWSLGVYGCRVPCPRSPVRTTSPFLE